MGIVYVLSNPAFDNYVKVGRTIDLEQRMKVLDNTSVPLLFRCVFAIEVDDDVAVERLVHQAFADVRVRTTCESPRDCRRLHFLRGLSNEQIQKIFPGNPGTCSTHGV